MMRFFLSKSFLLARDIKIIFFLFLQIYTKILLDTKTSKNLFFFTFKTNLQNLQIYKFIKV